MPDAGDVGGLQGDADVAVDLGAVLDRQDDEAGEGRLRRWVLHLEASQNVQSLDPGGATRGESHYSQVLLRVQCRSSMGPYG